MTPYIYRQTGEPLPKLTKSSCKAGLTFNLPCLIQELLGIKTVLVAYNLQGYHYKKQIWLAGHLYFLNKILTYYMKAKLYRYIWKLEAAATKRN